MEEIYTITVWLQAARPALLGVRLCKSLTVFTLQASAVRVAELYSFYDLEAYILLITATEVFYLMQFSVNHLRMKTLSTGIA
jgi:hypothetical protein